MNLRNKLLLSFLIFIAALVVVLLGFALTAGNAVATVVSLFLMGGFGFGTVPGLQSRIMGYANSAPTLACWSRGC